MNAFDQLRDALAAARDLERARVHYANVMARLLVGQLRNVDGHVAAELKAELQGFNRQTLQWRKPR